MKVFRADGPIPAKVQAHEPKALAKLGAAVGVKPAQAALLAHLIQCILCKVKIARSAKRAFVKHSDIHRLTCAIV